jgi:glutaredoxin-related protein
MKKIYFFSSKLCDDSMAVREYLDDNGIRYIEMDITENLYNLKMFLKYRDNFHAFDEIKEKGNIGIPCVMIDEGEKFFFQNDPLDLEELM